MQHNIVSQDGAARFALWPQSPRMTIGRVAGQSLTGLPIAVLAVFNLWLVA